MTFSLTMPALGESVTEGTVTRWLKAEGDHITIDEPLLEISTDKVDTEIPSPVTGTLVRIVVGVDGTVEVGAELAVIDDGVQSSSTPVNSTPVNSTPVKETPEEVVVEARIDPIVVSPVDPVQVAEELVASPPVVASASAGIVVSMPALGESVTEGTVTRWLKAVGDQVDEDEPLLEVSTDKVDTEIPSPASGTIVAIDVPVDSTVAVGARLALIGTSEAVVEPKVSSPAKATPTPPVITATPSAPAEATAPTAPVPPRLIPAAPVPVAVAQSVTSDSYVTPIVRQYAKEQGVDLSSVTGTGIGGRIRKEDVLAARPEAAVTVSPSIPPVPTSKLSLEVSPLRGTTVTMSRLRKVIASRMVESLQTSAQLTTVVEVDVTKISRLRDKAKGSFSDREGINLTFLPFFGVAVCEALKQHPVLNASVEGESITYHGAEHLGIAVDTDRGLLVPVIRDAGDLNIAGLSRKISEIAARTRENKISPDELGGGTFTITNTGSRGALFDTPIINQPQVAILGVGAIVKRPMVTKGTDGGETIAIRSMVYLALSYDHRIVDGADAARFLTTLKERLEEGRFEADLGL